MTSEPLFYNCWNQNVIAQFQTEDSTCWFATFGKHSKNFPIYGVSYDNLMLYDASSGTGYGLTEEVLPQLSFQWKEGIFKADFKGEVSVFGRTQGSHRDPSSFGRPQQPTGKTFLAVSLEFKTIPLDKNLLFLKRILPSPNRFIPGAVFQNQMLAPGASQGFLQIQDKKLGIIQHSLTGHLENGVSSFINSWAWNIVYRYLGILLALGDETRFYYNWRLYPLRPHSPRDGLVNRIKRKINKEVLVASVGLGQGIKHLDPTVLSTPSQAARELFKIPCSLGAFQFSRSFIEVKDSEDRLWHGILEDFKHPDIIE